MAKRPPPKRPARKTPARRKAAASKPAARKKARKPTRSGKKAGRKKAPARKSARKAPASKKAARKITRKAPARKKAAAPRLSAVEVLARKIVQATIGDPAQASLADLYAEGATSTEASGDTAVGFAGLEQKARQWEAMQERTIWKPRNVLVDSNTICIEWDAEVKLRDGRVVSLQETAVHDVEDGKIVAERYYYNPMALAPPQPA